MNCFNRKTEEVLPWLFDEELGCDHGSDETKGLIQFGPKSNSIKNSNALSS